MIWVILVFK